MSLKKRKKYNRHSKELSVLEEDIEKPTKVHKKKKKKKEVKEVSFRDKFINSLIYYRIKVGNKYVVLKDVYGELFIDYEKENFNAVKFFSRDLALKFCKDRRLKNYVIVEVKNEN